MERTTSPNTDTQTYSSGNKVDGLGNSYVTGFFFGTPTFGPGEATQTVLSTANQSAYVAKFNSVGALQWVKQTVGTSSAGLGIDIDDAGSSYVIGFYSAPTTFGSGEAL
ncbi:MAG: hypothetical protein DMG07_27145, partial [Acidobacteria bacterium]